jgi:hypothetical protein
MADPYATEAQLAEWLPSGTSVTDAARLLRRASEVLDSFAVASWTIVEETGLPSETTIATPLAEACCAQVEFWLEVGEEHDLTGLAGSGVAVGNLRVDHLPPELAPRAARILANAGLLSPGLRPAVSSW